MDNGTGSTIAKHSSKLQEKIQKKTDNMVEWLKDNRLCVAGEKSKLLVEGTKELRTKKDWSDEFVNIFGKRIDTSRSEKLLGVVVNQDLSWYNHLYGDEENKGLV